eukprot:3820786-Amphidinium_carterae.1
MLGMHTLWHGQSVTGVDQHHEGALQRQTAQTIEHGQSAPASRRFHQGRVAPGSADPTLAGRLEQMLVGAD